MEENRDNQLLNEEVNEAAESVDASVDKEANNLDTEAEKEKKEYKDPNEQWFTSGANAGASSGNYNYGQNSYSAHNQNNANWDMEPLTMGEWLLTILIGMVPCLGIVVFCVWAFGSSGNLNRRNYCRAFLIMQVIGIVLGILFAIFTAFFSLLSFGFYY